MAWAGFLLLIVFYVFAIVGTNMFGAAFPEFFGNLGASFYTLFQVMMLESWSAGVARPVMAAFPWAWTYFVPLVVVSACIFVNVAVGIIVGAVDETQHEVAREDAKLLDGQAKKQCGEGPCEFSNKRCCALNRTARKSRLHASKARSTTSG